MPFSMSGRTVGLISLILFILTIPAGNWVVMNVGTVCPPDSPCLIPVWPGIMSPSAVLFAGLALILRDAVQSLLGKRWTLVAIAAGAAALRAFSPSPRSFLARPAPSSSPSWPTLPSTRRFANVI